MPALPRIFKTLVATALAAALGAWLLAPEASRIGSAADSWAAWKQARNLDVSAARGTLDALSGALDAREKTDSGAWWKFPASSSGASSADEQRVAWDRAVADALSGSWLDAAAGFARAAGTGSVLPKDEAFAKLGDALYRIGERAQDDRDRMGGWKMAVSAYGKSLAEKYDDVVWENREFVLKKIREEAEKQNQGQGRPQPGQDGGQGAKPSPEDLRSLEQQMRDAARQDQELRKWLRPDGEKPAAPRLPSELLRQLIGGDSGGAGQDEKKDW